MNLVLSKFTIDGIEIAYCPEFDCIFIFKYFPHSIEEIVLDLTHETLHKVLSEIDMKLGFNEKLVNILSKLSFY